MSTTCTTRLFAVVGIAVGVLFTVHVEAADLGQAKAAGWLCEQVDGYLQVAQADAPADVKALANTINGQRRAEYQRIATKNGVAVEQVARLTAQKVIGEAPQFRCK